jgi:hypothetical protein
MVHFDLTSFKLDKIYLCGLNVEDYDLNIIKDSDLFSSFFENIHDENRSLCLKKQKNIAVQDIQIDSLVLPLPTNDYKKGSMQLSIKDPNVGNLRGLTINELTEKLKQVKSYLEELGLWVNFDDVQLTSNTEFACTFISQYTWNESKDALTMLATCMKASKLNLTNKNEGTISSGNKSIELKIYDKSKELRKKEYCIENEYIRFEFTLSSKKIIKLFGTNELSKLNQSQINAALKNIIKKMKYSYSAYQRLAIRKLRKLAKECYVNRYENSCNCWVDDVIFKFLNEENNGKSILLSFATIYDNFKYIFPMTKDNKDLRYRVNKRLKEIEGNLQFKRSENFDIFSYYIETVSGEYTSEEDKYCVENTGINKKIKLRNYYMDFFTKKINENICQTPILKGLTVNSLSHFNHYCVDLN